MFLVLHRFSTKSAHILVMIYLLTRMLDGGSQMDKKKLLMTLGALILIVFIGWFYIDQLRVPETVSEKNTIADQVNSTITNERLTDDGIKTSLQRPDSQGTVAIQTTLIPEKSSSNKLFFEIVFNTHSGDLLQYEIGKLAKLSFGSNTNQKGTFEWELANEDSHHLVGYLTWKGEVLDDRITLKLDNIANIPSRSFIWEKSDLAEISQNE